MYTHVMLTDTTHILHVNIRHICSFQSSSVTALSRLCMDPEPIPETFGAKWDNSSPRMGLWTIIRHHVHTYSNLGTILPNQSSYLRSIPESKVNLPSQTLNSQLINQNLTLGSPVPEHWLGVSSINLRLVTQSECACTVST